MVELNDVFGAINAHRATFFVYIYQNGIQVLVLNCFIVGHTTAMKRKDGATTKIQSMILMPGIHLC